MVALEVTQTVQNVDWAPIMNWIYKGVLGILLIVVTNFLNKFVTKVDANTKAITDFMVTLTEFRGELNIGNKRFKDIEDEVVDIREEHKEFKKEVFSEFHEIKVRVDEIEKIHIRNRCGEK